MRSHYVSVQLENQVKGLKDSETTKENASGKHPSIWTWNYEVTKHSNA